MPLSNECPLSRIYIFAQMQLIVMGRIVVIELDVDLTTTMLSVKI